MLIWLIKHTRHLFKKKIFLHSIYALLTLSWCIKVAAQELPAIIPAPQVYQKTSGLFQTNKPLLVVGGPGISDSLTALVKESLQIFSIDISQSVTGKKAATLRLVKGDADIPGAESYRLVVTPLSVTITAKDDAGIFYGLQSLLQLWQQQDKGAIPACTIQDAPRFAYRGMHLDVSRHLFPVAAIKKWLDILSIYKINRFHWHLTDDQGWRIEIKKYPRLQTISAYRPETMVGHKKEMPHTFDGKKYGGYYTREEVRDIVAYAAKRFITVIPEIEMPGHARAALAAYPELGCTGGPYETATFWGIFDDVFCAGNDQVFTFLQDVLDEVMDLFPSSLIHIGGDECPKAKWIACTKCQKRMTDYGLPDPEALQSYFIRRIEQHVRSRKKQIMGWDEILEGGLAPGAVVMSWRGEEGGIAAAKQNHEVIMTPDKFLYLDYYQSLHPEEPVAAGGYLPLKKIYQYEPMPASLTKTQQQYIKGVQANVWSEYLNTTWQAEYMMFPRMLALAELAWTKPARKNYTGFLKRLSRHQLLLQQKDITWPERYLEIMDEIVSLPDGTVSIRLTSDSPDWHIRFTTDGSLPRQNSTRYTGPINLKKTATLKAALFDKTGQAQLRLYEKDITISKATGKKISFLHQPALPYRPANNQTMSNGVSGTHRYNDGQWTGFAGEDMEIILDLAKETPVSAVELNILQYHWQRMWAPSSLVISWAVDGKKYQTVYTTSQFPVNGINTVRADFETIQARYIKIAAKNIETIPAGSYGAGGKAWLLASNLRVY